MRNRLLYWLTVILGFVGLAGCIAAIVAVVVIHRRLARASESVVGTVDNAVVVVRERVSQTQNQVRALKITSEGITQSIKTWTAAEARDRLTLRLGVKEKAERLASGLNQADHWLELTESSVELVQRALELVSATGIAIEVEAPERLLEAVTSLRVQLAQAIEPVENIREFAAKAGDDASNQDGMNRIVALALRLVATFSSIDSRLDNLSDGLSEIPTKTQSAIDSLLRATRIVAIGITLWTCLMAAGQGALCYLGWKGLRRRATAGEL